MRRRKASLKVFCATSFLAVIEDALSPVVADELVTGVKGFKT